MITDEARGTALERFVRRHERLMFCLACSFGLGMAAHAYFYFGAAFSQDSTMMFSNDGNWQISVGRFMIPVYAGLVGGFTVPWLRGLFCMLWAGNLL